ncbi:hypothetical protein [Micromonospora sp. NPDC005172]|uniref:hypothetical protein n=1 Tax=Micromonospora sp. NPDC005172 TaxID=3156867 RepID=UPI0033B46C37
MDECREFSLTWLPKGVYVSLEQGSVPLEVFQAQAVPGAHLLHVAPEAVGSAVVRDVLLAQPLAVVAQMVDGSAMSVVTKLDMAGAVARADKLGLPVLVPGDRLAGSPPERVVVAIDAQGRPALASADAEYVLVLPDPHLLTEHPATDGDLGGGLPQVLTGPPMLSQVRLIEADRAELGIPRPILDNLIDRVGGIAGIDELTTVVGEASPVVGEVNGLLRALMALEPGEAGLVTIGARGDETAATVLALQFPGGVGLLHDTPSGLRAATLPRRPGALSIAPARMSNKATALATTPLEAVVSDSAALAVTYLERPGLRLLTSDQGAQIAAADAFHAADDEYPVFVHGDLDGPGLGERLLTVVKLWEVIAADPRSHGKTIVLVQCGAAETPTILDDFAARLFATLAPTYPRVLAMGGTAYVQHLTSAATDDERTEVLVGRTVLDADGRLRLFSWGWVREYIDAPQAPAVQGHRTAKVIQHRPRLSEARRGLGVALTDDHGRVLVGEQAPTAGALDSLAPSVDDVPTITGVPFPLHGTSRRSTGSIPLNRAYNDVNEARVRVDDAVDSLHGLAVEGEFEPLVEATTLFLRTRHLQTQNSTTMEDEVFEHHVALNRVFEQTWDGVVNQAKVVVQDLRQRAAELGRQRNTDLEQLRTGVWGDHGARDSLTQLVVRWIPRSHHDFARQLLEYIDLSGRPARNRQQQAAFVRLGRELQNRDSPRVLLSTLLRAVSDAMQRQITTLERNATQMDGLADVVAGGKTFEDTWRRVSRDVARDVIAEVRRRLRYGPSNNYRTADKYGRRVSNLVNDEIRNESYLRQSVSDLSLLQRRGWNAYMATWFRGGNCEEYASVAFCLLWNKPQMRGVPITVVWHPVEHVYVLVGHPGHPNSLVVDAWPWSPSSTTVGHYFLKMKGAIPKLNAFPDQGSEDLFEVGRRLTQRLPKPPEFREVPAGSQGRSARGLNGYWDVTYSHDQELGSANSDSETEIDQARVSAVRATRFGWIGVDVETREVPSDYTNELLHAQYPWLANINPGRDAGGAYATNCVIAALSVDLSFRENGLVYEAATTPPLLGDDLLNYQQQVLGLTGGQQRVYEIPTIESALQALRRALPGSRAFITVGRPEGQVSHVLVGIRDERGVAVVDPQTGLLGRLPLDRSLLTLIPLSDEIQRPTQPVSVEAVGLPSWSVRLSGGVAEQHPNVYVIGRSAAPALQKLISQLAGAADVDHPVVLLASARPGASADEADIKALNYLLEQLAQRDRLPVVVARNAIDAELLIVVQRYGATILNPTLRRPDSVSAGLESSWWEATPSGRLWPDITPDALRVAAALARRTNVVTRIDDTLGELIWAPDLTTARRVFAKARERWSAQHMRDSLAHVEQMIERVPDQPDLSRYAPILEFGATGHADIVFDYALADAADKPATLLTAVGTLDTAGQLNADLDGGLTTGRLAAMVAAVGTTDISASVLTVIDDIKAGQFADANTFIELNRGRLTHEQKQHWVQAIADLLEFPTMQNNGEQKFGDKLLELAEGVLTC